MAVKVARGVGGAGVYLHALKAHRYDVERVELYAGDEITPFATTGPQ